MARVEVLGKNMGRPAWWITLSAVTSIILSCKSKEKEEKKKVTTTPCIRLGVQMERQDYPFHKVTILYYWM